MSGTIIESYENMKLEEIIRLLKFTSWANNRSPEEIEASCRNSACYGVFSEKAQKLVGFARVISDYTTTYYLCDVIIDPEYQHQGLGTALVEHIVSCPKFAGLRGILTTRNAYDLYRKFGFEVLNNQIMVKPRGQK